MRKDGKSWYQSLSPEERKKFNRRCNGSRKGQVKAYWKIKKERHPLKSLAGYSNNWYRNGKITGLDLWKIAHKQRLKCALSGVKLTRKNISVDHIIPKSRGGKNEIGNIRLVTRFVNTARQTMPDSEFINQCRLVAGYFHPQCTVPAS